MCETVIYTCFAVSTLCVSKLLLFFCFVHINSVYVYVKVHCQVHALNSQGISVLPPKRTTENKGGASEKNVRLLETSTCNVD